MKFKLFLAIIAISPSLVLAQTMPNMLGTWTTVAHTTVMGTGAHHIFPNKKDKEIYFNKVALTLVVDRQEGMNFTGTFTSKSLKEVILGAIAFDFQSGVMIDSDGAFNFKIVDENTIQACYTQLQKPKVAGCAEYKKI
jgi:hypothetical protein